MNFKVYLKYTSSINSWWTQGILEIYFHKLFSKLFFNYFDKVGKFGIHYLLKYTLSFESQSNEYQEFLGLGG